MGSKSDIEWWSVNTAAAETGYGSETIRQWAVKGRVRSRMVPAGGREYRQVVASDVKRELEKNQRSGRVSRQGPTPRTPSPSSTPSDDSGFLRDRVATLEELARRYRHIDELRDQIAQLHVQIARHHREIEIILQGPSMVPNDAG